MKSSSTTYTVECALAGPGSYDVSADFAPFAPGSWTFNCTWPPYRLDWKEVTTTIEISGGSWSCRRSDGYCAGTVQLVAGQYPPTATGYQAVTPNRHYNERMGIAFRVDLNVVPWQQSTTLSTPLAEVYAARSTVQVDSACPNDVRFYFPSSKQELWSSVSTLSAASPHFKTLFASEFAEGTVQDIVGALDDEDEGTEDGDEDDRCGGEDSDCETDRQRRGKGSSPKQSRDVLGVVPYRDVVINHTSYTTYRSVLVWIYSECIKFARLSSTFKDEDDRCLTIAEASADQPQLPVLAPPKSVYRLAHYLDIEELQKLALASIRSQISVHNVARELFSNLGRMYPEVQAMEIGFAVEHWREVKVTRGMKEVQRSCRLGEADSSTAAVLANLVMRLRYFKLVVSLETGPEFVPCTLDS